MKTKKSWLVEWSRAGGEWQPATRHDTPRTMRAVYMTKWEALRSAASLRASFWVSSDPKIKVRVVSMIVSRRVFDDLVPYPIS